MLLLMVVVMALQGTIARRHPIDHNGSSKERLEWQLGATTSYSKTCCSSSVDSMMDGRESGVPLAAGFSRGTSILYSYGVCSMFLGEPWGRIMADDIYPTSEEEFNELSLPDRRTLRAEWQHEMQQPESLMEEDSYKLVSYCMEYNRFYLLDC